MLEVLKHRHPGIRRTELGNAIAERAPHHTAGSWMTHWDSMRPDVASAVPTPSSIVNHTADLYRNWTGISNKNGAEPSGSSSGSGSESDSSDPPPIPSFASTMTSPYRVATRRSPGKIPRRQKPKNRTDDDRLAMAEFLSTDPPGSRREVWEAFLEQYQGDSTPNASWQSWAEHHRTHKEEISAMIKLIKKAEAAKAKKDEKASQMDHLLPSKRSVDQLDDTSDIGSEVVCLPKKPRSSTGQLE